MNRKYIESGRSRQKLKTYKKIFKAAQRLLMKGKVLTLESVANEADISRATIYRYYSNIDVLASELPLAIKDREPDFFVDEYKDLNIEDNILKVQEYYLNFTMDNEPTFRKFLGSILNSNNDHKRVGRRVVIIEKLLSEKRHNLSQKEEKYLTNISSLFMGIEALIVAKDVCNLDNKETLETLNWGLKMMLNGALKAKYLK